MDKPRQIAAVLFATAALAAFGVGCGDGDDSERESASAPPPPSAPADRPGSSSDEAPPRRDRPERSDSGPEERREGAIPPAAQAAAERDSGGGARQFRVPGGDNSIQTFGEEASESERHAAALVLHAFLQTRAQERWGELCSHLAASLHDQLRQLAPRAEGSRGNSCEEILAAISPRLSGRAEAEFIEADVGSLRVDDGDGFVLFRGADGANYTITMVKEAGRWKVASLAPVPLS